MKNSYDVKRGSPVRYDGENVTGIGYMLGEARKSKGLTLKEVAGVLGVGIQFISNIEHGRAPLPAKYVLAISSILGLDRSTVASLSLQKTRIFKDLKRAAIE